MDKTTVLVVEDDVYLLSGIREILELEQYHVVTAVNGVEGLKVLADMQDAPNAPELILSDISMPEMDGFTFLERVRAQDRWVTIPFIFLTARGEKNERYKGTLAGADVYLVKPFEAPELLVSVQACLKKSERIRRAQDNEVNDIKRKIMTILNHEFRTPLTLVVAYAEMLKDFNTETMTANDVVNFLKGVNSGADRLRRLVENFIMMVEFENGDVARTAEVRRRLVKDLKPLIEDALRQVEQPDTRPRQFVLEIAPDLPAVQMDGQYFTLIVRELLDNAAKFSTVGSKITLRVQREGERVILAVHDEGRGIPAHELENIWKPFYQVERDKFEDQGAGSGLAIVEGLAKVHGWKCDVQSTLGKGSVFRVVMPCNA
jgi:signal transduction histidine kinase